MHYEFSTAYELKKQISVEMKKRIFIYNVYYSIIDSALLLSEQNKESCYTISERVRRKRDTISS